MIIANQTWTPQEEEDLEFMWPVADITLAEMEIHFEQQRSTIIDKATRMGLKCTNREKQKRSSGYKSPRWIDAQHKLLTKLYEEDVHIKKIAERLHRTVPATRLCINKLGLHRRSPTTAQIGFDLGKTFFEDNSIKVLTEGSTRSAADFIVQYKGIPTAVNIKTGGCVISTRNMERLLEMDMPIIFVWFMSGRAPIILEVA
ncbi:hypothetical protein D4R42_04710 [bacterium]|nr:MAG: hypothetical protein D4R42_04710 [bacterium]